jgi:hypothetical protein
MPAILLPFLNCFTDILMVTNFDAHVFFQPNFTFYGTFGCFLITVLSKKRKNQSARITFSLLLEAFLLARFSSVRWLGSYYMQTNTFAKQRQRLRKLSS